jgi:hypothetical protein
MLTVAEMKDQTEALLRKSCEEAGGDYEEFIADINRAFDARFEPIAEGTQP